MEGSIIKGVACDVKLLPDCLPSLATVAVFERRQKKQVWQARKRGTDGKPIKMGMLLQYTLIRNKSVKLKV